MRFSDLASLVGRPSADALATYTDLAPGDHGGQAADADLAGVWRL